MRYQRKTITHILICDGCLFRVTVPDPFRLPRDWSNREALNEEGFPVKEDVCPVCSITQKVSQTS